MSIFDNLMDNLKSTAEVVSKKTEYAVEVSKIRFEIAKIKTETDKKYCELGELVYRACKGDEASKEASTDIVKAIDELKFKLKGFLEELDELENAVSCPSCGKRCDKNSRFCPECGAKISE